jgi:transcription initiation factor TFIIIB Brf1 subunit/transcription initiation factor TFIIB
MPRCLECDADLYIYDSIDITCAACGLVNAFTPMRSGSERGPPPLVMDEGAGGVIHYVKQNKVRQLILGNSMSYKAQILRVAEQLDIKLTVAEDAVAVFDAARGRPTWKKRKRDNMLAMYGACIYHACSRNGLHRPTHFISSRLAVSEKRIKNMVKQCNPQQAVEAAPLARSYIPHIVYNFLGIPSADAKRLAAEAACTAPAIELALARHNTDTVTAVIVTQCAARLGMHGLEAKVCSACNDVSQATVKQLVRGLA